MGDFFDNAMQYARLGWYLVPQGQDKKPLIKGWTTNASKDEFQIRQWSRKYPDANIAVVTGQKSGVVAIDLDDDDAIKRWEDVRVVCGMGREPPTVITRRGKHVYYNSPGLLRSQAPCRLGKDIDIRGENALATLPPSVHESGHVYRWAEDPPNLSALPLMTPALLRMLNGRDPYKDRKLQLAHTVHMDDILNELRRASAGGRNKALLNAAIKAGRLVRDRQVSELEAYQRLQPEGLALGLVRAEVMATIRSGLRYGTRPQ